MAAADEEATRLPERSGGRSPSPAVELVMHWATSPCSVSWRSSWSSFLFRQCREPPGAGSVRPPALLAASGATTSAMVVGLLMVVTPRERPGLAGGRDAAGGTVRPGSGLAMPGWAKGWRRRDRNRDLYELRDHTRCRRIAGEGPERADDFRAPFVEVGGIAPVRPEPADRLARRSSSLARSPRLLGARRTRNELACRSWLRMGFDH